MVEVAAIVSAALEDSYITATLSGGTAVTIFSDNAYESADLDFVMSESNKVIKKIIAKLGFQQSRGSRMFVSDHLKVPVQHSDFPLIYSLHPPGGTFNVNKAYPARSTALATVN